MEDRISLRLDSLGRTYEDEPEEEFTAILQEEYQYLQEHPDEISKQPGLDSFRYYSSLSDIGLLEECLNLLDVLMIPKKELNKYKETLQKLWSYTLDSEVVSNILRMYSSEVSPNPFHVGLEFREMRELAEQDRDEEDYFMDYMGIKIPNNDKAQKRLPYSMDSPEYQHVVFLHKEFQQPFDEYWTRPAGSSKPARTPNDYRPWNSFKESRDISFIVAQFMYFCLSGSIFPKSGEKTMIEIGAIIYDLLCVLEYRKEKEGLEVGPANKSIQKQKYDLVKRYLTVDQETGRYKQVK